MIKPLSCLTLFLLLLTFTTPHLAFAKQNQKVTFFSFFKEYLIAYTFNDSYNKHILAATTKAPTQEPSLTPIPPTPTNTPVNSSSIAPTNPPANPQPNTSSLSDVETYILQGVNDYRASLGLSSVQTSAQTCSFATTRAAEITTNFTHTGFYDRVNNHTLPYDSWSRAVENIAETPDYKEVVTLWENSPGHAANMRDSTPYVCIKQNGNYYAYEGMRP